ncbi:MAG: hypothetical protein LBI64_08440 [Coriobacteriales bacterium]|jgi:hypothetical protein|nr:hypothetical protein [Coriobacteriales bacterium]
MAKMTEEEASRLDEYYTENLPELDFSKPGIFARQKDTVVVLDSFTSKYLTSKGLATKRSPSELISDMVRHEMEAAG